MEWHPNGSTRRASGANHFTAIGLRSLHDSYAGINHDDVNRALPLAFSTCYGVLSLASTCRMPR